MWCYKEMCKDTNELWGYKSCKLTMNCKVTKKSSGVTDEWWSFQVVNSQINCDVTIGVNTPIKFINLQKIENTMIYRYADKRMNVLHNFNTFQFGKIIFLYFLLSLSRILIFYHKTRRACMWACGGFCSCEIRD